MAPHTSSIAASVTTQINNVTRFVCLCVGLPLGALLPMGLHRLVLPEVWKFIRYLVLVSVLGAQGCPCLYSCGNWIIYSWKVYEKWQLLVVALYIYTKLWTDNTQYIFFLKCIFLAWWYFFLKFINIKYLVITILIYHMIKQSQFNNNLLCMHTLTKINTIILVV